MTDRYDDTLILGYLEGDLRDDERAQFEQQLDADANLRALVEQLRDDRAAMRRLPKAEPPPGLVDAAMTLEERSMLLGDPDLASPEASDPGRRTDRRFRLRRTASYLAVAAIVAICACVMLVSLSDPWIESSTGWLSEQGFAMVGLGDEEPAPAAGSHRAEESRAKEADRNAASEAILADKLDERMATKRERLTGAVSAPATVDEALDVLGSETAPTALHMPAQTPLARADDPVDAGSAEPLRQAKPSLAGRAGSKPEFTETPGGIGRLDEEEGNSGAHLGAVAVRDADQLGGGGESRTDAGPDKVVIAVDTDDADTTRREVFDWLIDNAAAPAEPAVDAIASTKGTGPSTAQESKAEPITAVVEEQQLSSLLARLNARPGQRVRVTRDAAATKGFDLTTTMDDAQPSPESPASAARRELSQAEATISMETEATPPVEAQASTPPSSQALFHWPSDDGTPPSVPRRFAYGLVLEQQLPLVEVTPLQRPQPQRQTRIELHINELPGDRAADLPERPNPSPPAVPAATPAAESD